MARITFLDFSHTGVKEGCLCDRCGQWITNIWTVKFDDGITAHFGIDCYEKMCKDSRLNNYGMRLMKKTMKSLKDWKERLAEWEAMTEDKCIAYQNDQVDAAWNTSYWKGRPFEEYKQSMIDAIKNYRIPECEKELEKFSKINFKA